MTDMDINNLAHWFPVIEAAGIPVPKTIIIEAPEHIDDVLDGGDPPGFAAFIADIKAAANQVGYPAFLRTGHGSGKHEWERTCCLKDSAFIVSHVVQLVEWSHLVDIMGLPTNTWAVREMLPVTPLFHAFHGRMPIVREFRCFWVDDRVSCIHPYWPPASILKPDRDDWAERLQLASTLQYSDRDVLESLATRVGKLFDGNWSIDILETQRGWYVTDMAKAEESFHWESCESRKA